jgi:hypothetical protein
MREGVEERRFGYRYTPEAPLEVLGVEQVQRKLHGE